MGTGELLVLISCLFWAVSILSSDAGAKRCDCVSLTLVDFFIAGVVSLIVAVVMEPAEWSYPFTNIRNNWHFISIVGFTEGSGFTLATIAQMHVEPSRAGLLLSLETVSTALCGYLFLNETLTHIELLGCFLMFAATYISSSFDKDDDDDGGKSVSLLCVCRLESCLYTRRRYHDIHSHPFKQVAAE